MVCGATYKKKKKNPEIYLKNYMYFSIFLASVKHIIIWFIISSLEGILNMELIIHSRYLQYGYYSN